MSSHLGDAQLRINAAVQGAKEADRLANQNPEVAAVVAQAATAAALAGIAEALLHLADQIGRRDT